MPEQDGRGDNQFICHPNTRTLHRGTREVGAECGQPLQSGGWGRVDAENPVDAVLTYGTPPCTKCFKHTNRLNTLYLIEHSARVVCKSKQDVLDLLPWDEPEKELATDGGEEVGRATNRMNEYRDLVDAVRTTRKAALEADDRVDEMQWIAAGGLGGAPREELLELADALQRNAEAIQRLAEEAPDPREVRPDDE